MGFHIITQKRKTYGLEKFQYDEHGKISFPSHVDYYRFSEIVKDKIEGIIPSDIWLFSLIVTAVERIFNDYHKDIDNFSDIFQNISSPIKIKFNIEGHISKQDILLLWLENVNPASKALYPFFDYTEWSNDQDFQTMIDLLNKTYKGEKPVGNTDLTLPAFLYEPISLYPNSLEKQLRFILKNWSQFLGDFSSQIKQGLDQSAEEMKFRGTGSGVQELPDFSNLNDIEGFSHDLDWMPNVVMIAKNALVWMNQLSKFYNRNITRLDHIPDKEIAKLVDFGFNAIWLIGIWKRSPASKTIKNIMGNSEAEASAYSLSEYDISDELGGWDALNNLKDRCLKRGVRLAGDIVPNHTGLDSPWLAKHPDWYISADQPSFPSYRYTNQNISSHDKIEVYLEDHYFNHSDAAVTFKLVDKIDGNVKYIYHGNDGTSMPWNDTAQLNYLNPELRETVIQTIIKIAKTFQIIRFDAAMTLAKKHIQRLWFPPPGEGGGIPSRWQYAMSDRDFQSAIPKEFWREVVDRVAEEVPDTLLLAEAFWMMEGYFVRTLGMHRVYNSAFMNMLKIERNSEYRELIKKTLEYDPQILKRYVNFLNNPDEDTAVAQFGKADKYFGVTIMMCTLPGLPMFGHGQIEGFEEKYGMEFRKAYREENPDQGFIDHHYRIITPLLKHRHLFSGVDHFSLFPLIKQDKSIDESVFVYSNRRHETSTLVIYNNSIKNTAGWINKSEPSKTNNNQTVSIYKALNIPNNENTYIIFSDTISGLEYIRHATEFCRDGLFIQLQGYQTQVFMNIRIVQDSDGLYSSIHKSLRGSGTGNIESLINKQVNSLLRKKAVIFDMDGTLLNTLEDIGDSVNTVLKKYKLPTHTIEQYRYFVGSGIEHLMEIALPEELRDKASVEKYLTELKVVYRGNLNTKSKLYDGIPKLLDKLTKRNIVLGVFTNKPHQFALECDAEFLSKWDFEVNGVNEKYPPKPDTAGVLDIAKRLGAEPEDCLYIGDTNIDMKTANNAGMTAVGVKWGFRCEKELWNSGAKFVVDKPEEILGILEEIKK